jgi:[CysO sulfur-carrier protein]-S-L-cysteine hydrolase
MVGHLRTTFPDEGCGVLAAADGTFTKVYPIKNVSESPVVYEMDPQGQLEAMLDMDDHGWDLAAIFHSHTRTRAYPSQTDVKLSFYPEALQIIISFANFDRPDVRAYRIENGEIREEALEIVE